jgi:hypothetical protein
MDLYSRRAGRPQAIVATREEAFRAVANLRAGASGMQEKYLEAYSMVEALELQLDALRQASLPSFERS